MPDTPKPYTDEELLKKRDYLLSRDAFGEQDQSYPYIKERYQRLFATIADRDRKLAVAEKALGNLRTESHDILNDPECTGDERNVAEWVEGLAACALAAIREITTPKS